MAFYAIVLTIFSLLFSYLSFGLVTPYAHDTKILLNLLLAAMFVSIVWVPLVFWQRDSLKVSRTERKIYLLSYCALGVSNFLWIFLVLRDVSSLFVAYPLHTALMSETIFGVSFIVFAGGMISAHFGLSLKSVRVAFPGLPDELCGLKIVQVSDLHVGPTIRNGFVQKVMTLVNQANPDLIVLTGDLADGSAEQLMAEMEPLRLMSAPLGKYFVTGNHEYYWEPKEWIGQIESLGFVPLLNTGVTLSRSGKEFSLSGVSDPAAKAAGMEGPDFNKAMNAVPSVAFPKIVLCHQPQFAQVAEQAGFDLQLSGHTHGGQFFPWTLLTPFIHRFNAGLGRQGKMQIYVSRGTGYWGPPVRLGSPPEVTLIILEKENASCSV